MSKLSKSKVSWTKESTLPEEEIKPYESQIENDFNTPNPEVEHEQITSKQNVSKNTSKLKSLTNKSLVLSSQDNQPVNILNMESEKYLKKSSHHKLG